MWRRGKLSFTLATMQFLLIVVFTLSAYYGRDADPSDSGHSFTSPVTAHGSRREETHHSYTALEKYCQYLTLVLGLSLAHSTEYCVSGLGQALLSLVLGLQLSLAWSTILDQERISVDMKSMVRSCNAVLSLSVAMRSVQGRMSSLQLVFFHLMLSLSYEINLRVTQRFAVHDMFPATQVLMFGSFFGAMASHFCPRQMSVRRQMSICPTDRLVHIVSIAVEYMTWPEILSGLQSGCLRNRIVVNTILCQSSALVSGFAAAALISPDNRFDVNDISAGLTGGMVSIAAVSGFMVYPSGALLIGTAGTVLSVLSLHILSPYLVRKLRAPVDHFQAVSSFCLPSILSALLSVVYTSIASEADYGLALYEIFPSRAPHPNSIELEELQDFLPRLKPGYGHSALHEATMQMATICVTLVIAAISGALVGFSSRFRFLDPMESAEMMSDASSWHVPDVVVLAGDSAIDAETETADMTQVFRTRVLRTRSVI